MESRTVVITGVSRGLGRAMALAFARAGHRVVGCARDKPQLSSLGDELGDEHDFQSVDVSGSEVGPWAEGIVERFGAPHLVINNAALINELRPLWEVSESEFDRLLAVNIGGVFRVCRAFLPSMIEAGRGVLVNFSSGWGRSVSPGVAPYCATKFAIEGMTRALAEELPAGLAAVAMSPGVIDTEMLRTVWGEGAAAHRGPTEWALDAVPRLLELGVADNGGSLRI